MASIQFFSEDVDYTLPDEKEIKGWINKIITAEGYTLESLNYIFCSDEYLNKINQKYLNHNTYTDIITFDQSETAHLVSGDIFVSIDRIKDNSTAYSQNEHDELCRVLIHGVLHLMGYSDGTQQEKSDMRKKEEACLSLR